MAKIGEGDPRWIVNVREDGTNVNQWHWKEKDCTEWTRQRLNTLFTGLTLVSGSCTVTATGLRSVEGDAYLNVRKAKLIASYELNIKVDFEGTTADGQAGDGYIELPYVADENHDEDPEVRVVLPVDSKASQELKAAILAHGKQAIYTAVAQYVQELRDGLPSKQSSGAVSGHDDTTAAAGGPVDSKPSNTSSALQSAANEINNASTNGGSSCTKSKTPSSSSRSSISLTERFYATKVDIFECFTVQGRIQAFTQSPAVVTPQPGGKFSWFSGSITGTFEELEVGQTLVMTWRFSNWQEECSSKVVISLSEPEPGNTILKLKQTGLPEVDKFGNGDIQEQVERGWQDQVFGRIRAVFGYGV
eukprot:gene610-898_t